MFICEIWLFDWYFPQFSTSDMSKYRDLEVFQRGPFDFGIKRIDCIFICGDSPQSLVIMIEMKIDLTLK